MFVNMHKFAHAQRRQGWAQGKSRYPLAQGLVHHAGESSRHIEKRFGSGISVS
jgi:hypothetical protein